MQRGLVSLNVEDIWVYIKTLFSDHILVYISAFGAMIVRFLFPTYEYKVGAIAVMCIIILDVITKIYSLSRINGGLKEALKSREINSRSLAKGTLDKLVVFAVMLIICGLLYNMTIIAELAIWFTQVVFLLMFFRDVLSVLENLSDAGLEVGIFKFVVRRKLEEYVSEEELDKISPGKKEGTSGNDKDIKG